VTDSVRRPVEADDIVERALTVLEQECAGWSPVGRRVDPASEPDDPAGDSS